MNELRLLAFNLTRRCNLACPHCYLDADSLQQPDPDELDTEAVCQVLDQVGAMGHSTMVVLTGGEPLVRADLETICRHGVASGLVMVVGTNGVMLTRRRAAALQAAGVTGMGISLDSLDPERHDRFRGLPGAWRRTMAAIKHCRERELDFQLHFTVTPDTVDEVPGMAGFAARSGARVLNVFFVICTGRGTASSRLSWAQHEQVLQQLVELQRQYPEFIVRPRCAPQFKRVALSQSAPSATNLISGSEGDGCIAGTHYCRVTSHGELTACPYIPDVLGSVRDSDLANLWQQSPTLQQLRQGDFSGKCGVCEYRLLCGGCRAGALAQGNGLMGEDPACGYQPVEQGAIAPLPRDAGGAVRWTVAAEQRLARIPAPLRKMIRRRAEVFAQEQGHNCVTPNHLKTLAARRFGPAGPPREWR